MQGSLLEQLRGITVVVADTGDLQQIERFRPRDATTNPSLVTAAADLPHIAPLVDEALGRARAEHGSTDAIVHAAGERLAIELGRRILGMIDGRVSTEVDARIAFDTEKTIAKAHEIIAAYGAAGVSKERVLIKIASTWEGIRAAERLEREGIHCNLTLLFGFHQAVACADAGVTLISPFVGRILDWQKKKTGRAEIPPVEDLGVQSVTRIYRHYKRHAYKTEVMGASFRNSGEILELAGCDLLTISPGLLAELDGKVAPLTRKLDPAAARALELPRETFDETRFRDAHRADEMSNEKLDEGIKGFAAAAETLERKLAERLSK